MTFQTIEAIPAPLLEDNVDTDVIFPARFLLLLDREGLGQYAFAERRRAGDDFILDRVPYNDSAVLVAGRNFGSGSSREQAVWALEDLGIRAIIARSFGEIFFANAFRNGLLPIVLDGPPMDRVEAAAEAAEPITVDLERQEIRLGDGPPIGFDVPPNRRRALMAGLDEVDAILTDDLADIVAYEEKVASERPWTTIAPAKLKAIRAPQPVVAARERED
ncbi:MAG: 3-isopropylmalate dehydratase small subunit [Pseudomonadota bacterium]